MQVPQTAAQQPVAQTACTNCSNGKVATWSPTGQVAVTCPVCRGTQLVARGPGYLTK